jgi:hypothetical protein
VGNLVTKCAPCGYICQHYIRYVCNVSTKQCLQFRCYIQTIQEPILRLRNLQPQLQRCSRLCRAFSIVKENVCVLKNALCYSWIGSWQYPFCFAEIGSKKIQTKNSHDQSRVARFFLGPNIPNWEKHAK